MSDAIRIGESERPLRAARPLNPQREIWTLLRDHAERRRADRDETRRRLAEERGAQAELVVAVVNVHHQLTAFAEAHGPALEDAGLAQQRGVLEGLNQKLSQAARQAGARVLAPRGEEWRPDDETWADVVASEPDPEASAPVVRQTLVPGVWLRGELVQRASVVVAVPATEPEHDNPDENPVPERNPQ